MGKVQSSLGQKVTEKKDFSPSHSVSYGNIHIDSSANQTLYRFPTLYDNEYSDFRLPARIDLRQEKNGCFPYPPVGEQDILKNCSSEAVISAFQCVERKQNKGKINMDYVSPSVLFNYFYSRKLLGNTSYDSGTSVEASLGAMMVGVAEEKYWPFDKSRVNDTPTEEAQLNALKHSVSQWDQLEPTLENIKTSLANGYPVIFSFLVNKTMDKWFSNRNDQISTRFLLQIDQFSREDIVAAHSILIIGYDDTYTRQQGGAFLCRNSWGNNFGLDGHFWFSYTSALYPEIVPHFFIIKEVCVQSGGSCVSKTDCNSLYSNSVCQTIQ
jgi:C1A family cysteine protease